MPVRRRVSHAAAADRNLSARHRKSGAAAADHGSARRRLRKILLICVIKSTVVFTYCFLLT
jgi:hypothetical protein